MKHAINTRQGAVLQSRVSMGWRAYPQFCRAPAPSRPDRRVFPALRRRVFPTRFPTRRRRRRRRRLTMSSSPAASAFALPPSAPPAVPGEKSYFEQQRDHLRSEIALAMEHVLMNMNTLNRNLESVVAVRRKPRIYLPLGR